MGTGKQEARRCARRQGSVPDEFRLPVERNALRGKAADRCQRGITADIGAQRRGAGRQVEHPGKGIVRTVERRKRGVRLQVEARQEVAAAIEFRKAAQAVHVERREVVIRTVEPFEARHRDIQLRECIAAAIEPLQARELPEVGKGRNAQPRTIHAQDALRLVARNASVTVDIERSEAVRLEGFVVECQVDVFVLLVTLVFSKTAGRAEQHEQDGKDADHRQRQISTSSSELLSDPSELSSSP